MGTKTPNVYERRREHLRLLIEQWGGPGALARKLGYKNSSFLVQMCGPSPTREVTEHTARRIEQALALPTGWLDDHSDNKAAVPHVDMSQVATIIRVLVQTAEDEGIKLTPAKLGDLVALVYQDAEAHDNKIRQDFIDKVLQLVK